MGAGRKQGLISNPRGHGEFVRLTDEGLSKALAVELFGTQPIRSVEPMTALGGRPVVRSLLPSRWLLVAGTGQPADLSR